MPNQSCYIITMHCPLNYGAILQTYALQTYIESLGVNVRVIDYRPDYIVDNQSYMYIGDDRFKRSAILRWVYRLSKAPSKYKRIKAFKLFSNNELHLTPTFHSFAEIKEANLIGDLFICGSDQIWNVVSGAYKDPSYFLGFVPDNVKKISYAASGNLSITDETKEITLPMINRIDCISMREESTIENIQPYINKAISHVCDPVFLLSPESWRMLYKQHSRLRLKDKYVLVYPMGSGADKAIQKASIIAKQLHLPLYLISASQRRDSRISKQFNVSPYEFLSLIDNAEFIVTNSFHGTSFSIIFKKQFWTTVAEGSNQRITSLLAKAGLQDRLLFGDCLPDYDSLIDYNNTLDDLGEFINLSQEFIHKSFYE